MHWESCSLALPKIEGDNGFKIAAMTDSTPGSVCIDSEARKVTIPPRSMAVLTGEYQERKKPSDVAAVGKQAKDEKSGETEKSKKGEVNKSSKKNDEYGKT